MVVFPLILYINFFLPRKNRKKKKNQAFRLEINELSDNKKSTDKRNTV